MKKNAPCKGMNVPESKIEDQNMKIAYFYLIKIIFSINNSSFEFFILNSWISIFYLPSSGRIITFFFFTKYLKFVIINIVLLISNS